MIESTSVIFRSNCKFNGQRFIYFNLEIDPLLNITILTKYRLVNDFRNNQDLYSEKDLIRFIGNYIDTKKQNILGYNEDAVAFNIGDQLMVINIDGWVSSTDRPSGLSLHDCGYRAVINAASDVIAKGANVEGMIVSLSLPKKMLSEATSIIDGILNAASKYGINYYGGDLNSCTDLVIDVTIWGVCNKNLVKRSGAINGQKLCWLGPTFGSNAAAIGVLTKAWKAKDQHKMKSLEVMGKPKLFPEFIQIDASSAIDCSDGLAASLYLLADSSQVGFELDKINMFEKWVQEVAETNGKSVIDLALYGGEELGILFTCSTDTILPNNVLVIGKVVKYGNITIHGDEIANIGWEHFID